MPDPCPEERCFLDAIVADPGDDTARLVYADWLQEHDRGEYAEFIRLQCELGRCEGLHIPMTLRMARLYATGEWLAPLVESRVASLLSEFGTAWCQESGADAATAWEWGWSRGFIESITLPCAAFMDRGRTARLFRRHPITGVTLSDKRPHNSNPTPTAYRPWTVYQTNGADDRDHHIPGEIFYKIGRWYYATEAECAEAISDACVSLGREWAAEPVHA